MSNLNKKLLAEAFDALYSSNDIAKATRLFQRHWNSVARNSYALLESEDEEFEISDMGDDFNQEIVDEAGSDKEEKFEQLLLAVDELEDKFPSEITEEIQEKFDEVRNLIDEMKLAEEDEEVSVEDAIVAIEDLKAEFEVAGEIDEETQSLFDEITSGIQGDETEVDVADEDDDVEDFDDEESDEIVEESVEDSDNESNDETDEGDEELDLDSDFSDDDLNEESEEDSDEMIEDEAEEEGDLVLDAKSQAEELLATLEELEAQSDEVEEDVEDDLTESWEKAKLPRNKLQNEEEGVKKEGMKFGKPSTISSRKGMGVAHTVSAGTSANKKVKVCKTENKGAKSWTKLAKPSNTAKDAKSLLGKK